VRICKHFEISRTIYLRKVKPIFETECFFLEASLLLKVFRSNLLEQLKFKLEKNIGI